MDLHRATNLRAMAAIATFLFIAILINFLIIKPIAFAASGINEIINFQGKIVTASGVNIPNGTYNMEFKIYAGGTDTGGGTLDWTEDYLVGGSGGGIAFSGGTFDVGLGSVCPFNGGSCETYTNTTIDWNTYPLYLSIQVGNTSSCTVSSNFHTNCAGDGEMSPYILLTSTPYSFNSNELGGIDSSGYVQISPGSAQAGNINIGTGTITSGAIDGQTIGGASVLNGTLSIQGASALTLGSGSNDGSEIFVSSGGINTVTLQAPTTNPISSYVLSLPTTAPGTSQCLESGASTATQLTFGACSTLQSAYDAGSSINTTAGGTLTINASAPPTADIVSISNSGQPTTTDNANGLGINYNGGNASVEGAGLRIDYTPGGTSGGTWDGLSIVANSTGPVSGVTSYGIKLVGPSSAGAGTSEGAYIGTGWNIGLDIQSGGIQLATQNTPPTPTANNLRIYSQSIAGRVLPMWVGPSGITTPFQASLGFNRVSIVMPAGGTTLTTFVGGFGSTFTNTGTANNPTPTSTNLFTSTRRATFSTGTTAGTVASHRQSVLQVWRGNAAGRGGFFYTIRFGTDTLVSGNRAFVGMADSVSAPTNVDPTTSTTPGKIGMAINSNTGDWNFVNNITGTAPTVTNLGASFPVNTTDLYQLVMFSPEDGTSITYSVTDISTGATVTASVSTNIPSNTTFLAPNFWITNNATAAAAILDFGGWYMESDN